MIAAAATLAERYGISRARQDEFAILSHRKALQNPAGVGEIVSLAGLARDAFPRALTAAMCARLAPLAGDSAFGVTRATVAVEADAAAALLVVSERMARRLDVRRPVRIVSTARRGGDPAMPGTAPIAAAQGLLAAEGAAPARIAVAEIMEAFAAQAIACIDGIGVVAHGGQPRRRRARARPSDRVRPVRSSPSGCGTRCRRSRPERSPWRAIAAAGGLGSALLATV